MNAVIVGCSRQGALLAAMLEEENINVTVIDLDTNSFSRLTKFKGKKILGDGVKESTLDRAGLKDADFFAAVTNNDNINIMSAQIARSIYKIPKVVCRVYDPKRAAIYSDFGLETVNFSKTGAYLLKSAVIGHEKIKRYQLGDGSGIALEIEVGPDLIGKKIEDIDIPGKFRISAIIRGLKVLIAKPDFEIKIEDRIFGVVKTEELKEVLEDLGAGPKENTEKKHNENTPSLP